MAVKYTKFGPGTLVIGAVGSPTDISCQIIQAKIEWDKDEDDDVTTLCGDVVPGAVTYSATMSGELFQDVDDPAGIMFTSWTNKGEVYPFVFTPNTAQGTHADGNLILDPVPFGSDEPKANMTADFSWKIVGEPTLTVGVAMAATEAA